MLHLIETGNQLDECRFATTRKSNNANFSSSRDIHGETFEDGTARGIAEDNILTANCSLELCRTSISSACVLHLRYLVPFHAREVSEILSRSRRTAVVECNYTGQFARHLRAETGISVDALILKYDGEPLDPGQVAEQAKAIVEGRPRDRRVTLGEAREIAYHYLRIHLGDKARPVRFDEVGSDGYGEPLWEIEVADRKSGNPLGQLLLGRETGATHAWHAYAR